MLAALIILQAATGILPYGYLEACAKHPDRSCVVEHITPQDLSSLHAMITEAIKTRDDPGPYDAWREFPRDPDGQIYGDCDDQVATERRALIDLGIDPKRLTIETGEVRLPSGEMQGHVVLIVELDGVRYVLDRREPRGAYLATTRPKDWRPMAVQNHSGMIWRPQGE